MRLSALAVGALLAGFGLENRAAAEAVVIDGVTMQVQVTKTGPWNDGILQADADVTVDGNLLPLKSGEKISWWVAAATLVNATLRTETTLTIRGQTYKVQGGVPLYCARAGSPHKAKIQKVSLVGGEKVAVEGVTITAGAGTAMFDTDGFLQSFAAAKQEIAPGGNRIVLEEGAFVVLKSGKSQASQWLLQIRQGLSGYGSIDIAGQLLPASDIEFGVGSLKVKRVKFLGEQAKATLAGQAVVLNVAEFDGGVLTTVELGLDAAKLNVDGTDQAIGRFKPLFVSPDLLKVSMTKAGLAAAIAAAPPVAVATATPAVAATPPAAAVAIATATPAPTATPAVAKATPTPKPTPKPLKIKGLKGIKIKR